MDLTKLIKFNFVINNRDAFIFSLVVVGIIILYYAFKRSVVKSRMANDQKRRFIGSLRMFSIFILATSILVLWSSELYQFTLSIAALAAAFAIAGKEVFLCFGGSFYKAFARPFSVGDRIEINDIRGDVVDVGIMSTQLLEVGPKDYTQQLTGRTITIPNSLFLTQKVFNETDAISEGRDFVLHVFKVPITADAKWKKKKDVLLFCSQEAVAKYVDPAKVFFETLAHKKQVDAPSPEARVNVKFESANQILLIVRVSIPVERRGIIEQDIINQFLEKCDCWS